MRLRTLLQRTRRLTRLPAPARRAALAAGVAAAGLAGCSNDVNVTNQNAANSASFPSNQIEANQAVVAAYNPLLRLGTFQRWIYYYDLRSDIGTSDSPRADFKQLASFQYPAGYDAEVNNNVWSDQFTLISRANFVVANVPNATMDAALKAQYVAEGKFLRGLSYFYLYNWFGPNIPLITTPQNITDRPASSDSATIFAQIETDFSEAASALPINSVAGAAGRATRGAAQGMLGKVQLQQRKYAAAAATLAPIVQGQVGTFSLEPSYARLFTQAGNQNAETLFEVQMGSPGTCGQGVCGLNIAKMIGPQGFGFTDGQPTRFFFNEFQKEKTTSGGTDPRLDATMYYYRGDTTRVYSRTWAGLRDTTKLGRYSADASGQYQQLFWKKYTEYYTGANDQSWEAQINYKILRYADVLLMYAEALNETGQTAAAVPQVNRVRARAQLAPLAGGMSQAALRDEILHQRILEFGLEGQRWLDMRRTNAFADLATLKARDPDFNSFTVGLSQNLPLPTGEIIRNPNLKQYSGY